MLLPLCTMQCCGGSQPQLYVVQSKNTRRYLKQQISGQPRLPVSVKRLLQISIEEKILQICRNYRLFKTGTDFTLMAKIVSYNLGTDFDKNYPKNCQKNCLNFIKKQYVKYRNIRTKKNIKDF